MDSIKMMTERCKHCRTQGVFFKSDIMLRPAGYDGGFQAYVKCSFCGKEHVLTNEKIPKPIWDDLVKRWERALVIQCKHCDAAGAESEQLVPVDEINLRERGHRGNFQAYVACPSCGKEITLPNEEIPIPILDVLVKRWNE